jgi:hypothetical protein
MEIFGKCSMQMSVHTSALTDRRSVSQRDRMHGEVSMSAYSRIAAIGQCYQVHDKQSASLTLSIGCANTLYTSLKSLLQLA